MTVKKFEEFIKSGVVKKQTPNRARALSIIEEVKSKKQYLEISIKSIPKEKLNANVIVDQCYDVLMELIRAKLYIEGYNAGNSHEAEVSYLKILGFIESDLRFMDELRYYRNGTKYYGIILNMKYAEQTLAFMEKMYPKLLKTLDKDK